MEQTTAIIPAHTAITTFRDAGYRNTAAAISELIDNSIEAEASDIEILVFQELVAHSQRTMPTVTKIGVYDNGCGMPPEVLAICLQFGNGTRLTSRKGIGRFGIGLPQASVSQCKRVEVFSWQNDICYKTYLDIDEIVNEKRQNVSPIEECAMPEHILRESVSSRKASGTLIVWSQCDRLDFARAKTLYNRMSNQLCRTYRHHLDSDNQYGRQCKISMVVAGPDRDIFPLSANDPLYLLTPNNLPGHSNEATNEQYGEVTEIPIEYEKDDQTLVSIVEMRFSIAKPATQELGGGSELGAHYRDNTGISFMRAGREIDFGTFGYFNPREERQRWWGCEIRFSPDLDELFGVTNNKQAVREVDYLDLEKFKEDHPEDWDEELEASNKLKLRVELSRNFTRFHKRAMNTIRSRMKGSRGGDASDKAKPDRSTNIANEILQGSDTPTGSLIEGQEKPQTQREQEWITRLLASESNLTLEQATDIAPLKTPLKIEKDFKGWPGAQFFTVEVTGSTAVLVINQHHPFYSEVYERLLESEDPNAVDALDLLLYGYARMQDERYSQAELLDGMNEDWGRHVKSFLVELRNRD
jgi:hypothetical protein